MLPARLVAENVSTIGKIGNVELEFGSVDSIECLNDAAMRAAAAGGECGWRGSFSGEDDLAIATCRSKLQLAGPKEPASWSLPLHPR